MERREDSEKEIGGNEWMKQEDGKGKGMKRKK